MRLIHLSVAILLALPATNAWGASFDVGCAQSTTINLTQTSPTASATMSCPQFDPSLGTLTEAVFFQPTFATLLPGASFTVHNTGSVAITLPPIAPLFATSIAITFGPYPNGQSTVGFGPLGANGPLSLQPGASATYQIPSFTFGSNPGYEDITGASLHAFVGSGNFAIPISIISTPIAGFEEDPALQLVSYSASFYLNGSTSNVSPTGIAPLDVVRTPGMLYTYTPTPEPSSMALGACTLIFTIARKYTNTR